MVHLKKIYFSDDWRVHRCEWRWEGAHEDVESTCHGERVSIISRKSSIRNYLVLDLI